MTPPIASDGKKCGIYCIENIQNGKLYIGKSIHIYCRIRQHFLLLERGKHANVLLQRAWSKLGHCKFKWTILLECREPELAQTETRLVLLYKTIDLKQGYNIEIPNGQTHRHSEYVKAKISKSLTGRIVAYETGRKISAALTGRIGSPKPKVPHSPERRDRFNQLVGIKFTLISPTGEVFNGVGLKRFCLERGLNPSEMAKVVNGTYYSCKGWSIPNRRARRDIRVSGKIMSPDGTVHKFDCLKVFCRKFGLTSSSCVSDVLNGKAGHYKGWVLPG